MRATAPLRRMTPRNRGAVSLCVALALACPLARAAGSASSCTASATGVVFGTYTPLAATALLANGTVSIACTGVTGNDGITIDLSTGASGSYSPTRKLTSGTFTLNYNLYLDGGYTEIWGNGTGGSVAGSANVTNGHPNVTLTVYGSVAAGQDPSPGSYGDSITVSVNY